MPIAVGGSSPPRSTAYSKALSVNITDYGGAADNATDNATAFEAAYAALIAKMNNTQYGNFYQQRGYIYFPGGSRPYAISRPLKIEDPYVWIVGDGPASKIEQRGLGPCVILGVRTKEQVPNGTICQLDASYRPDLFGKLDTSLVTGPNQRWGIRTNANSSVMFQAVPFSHGGPEGTTGALDNWGTTSALTIECCVEAPDGGIFPPGYVGGILVLGTGSNMVFQLQKGGGTNQFDLLFRCADDAPDQVNTASISTGGATGPQRLAFQLDLVTRKVTAYVNGVQTAVSTGGPFYTRTGATTLARNEFCSLHIGLVSYETDLRAPVATPSTQFNLDLRLYGLAFSRKLRYKDRGVGLAQQRVDDGTLNDNYRYQRADFSDRSLVAFLTLLDDPSNPLTGRNVTSMSAYYGGSQLGYFFQVPMYSLLGGIKNNGIADLRLTSSFPTNPTVAVGAILDLTIERCMIEGGTQAIGTLNLLANYTTHIIDCELSATDSCYYGSWSAVVGRNVSFRNAARATIRTFASNTDFDDSIVLFANEQTESIVKSHAGLYGGFHRYVNMKIDFEGSTYRVAPFYFEQYTGFIIAPATSYEVKNIYMGTTGACPLFKLVTRQDYANDGINYIYLDVNNIQTIGSDYTSIVELDGPSVTGEVSGVFPPNGPQFKHLETKGAGSSLVVRSMTLKAPPRIFSWYAGAHVLDCRTGVDGQFTQFRCVSSGAYGTPTPPTWAGLNPQQKTPSSLAGYVLNHAYITAALS